MRKATTALFAIALAFAAIAIAGCGGDDDSSSGSGGGSTTEQASGGGGSGGSGGGGGSQTVDVSETDFKIDPADPTVKAGTVTFKVTNDGQTTHNLEVEGPGEEQELPSDLAPGQSGELTIDLSKPGTYEWYCPVGNHRDLGMEGEITVQ